MTGLTYDNRDQAWADRQQQERLLKALDAAPFQLRRDGAGWWAIAGRRGTIQTWGDGRSWLVYVIGRSARHWTAIKQRLAFMTVTQDGDEEGCLRLFALPTSEEATLIRGAVSLRKRRALTDEAREALIAAGVNGRFRAQGAATALRLVPEDTPILPHGKFAPNPWINAVEFIEREEVA